MSLSRSWAFGMRLDLESTPESQTGIMTGTSLGIDGTCPISCMFGYFFPSCQIYELILIAGAVTNGHDFFSWRWRRPIHNQVRGNVCDKILPRNTTESLHNYGYHRRHELEITVILSHLF